MPHPWPTILAAAALAAASFAAGRMTAPEPRRADQPASALYVGAAGREPFHLPGCEWAGKINPATRESFTSREEAIKAGRRPCKVCRP